jgi:hypothetical protein
VCHDKHNSCLIIIYIPICIQNVTELTQPSRERARDPASGQCRLYDSGGYKRRLVCVCRCVLSKNTLALRGPSLSIPVVLSLCRWNTSLRPLLLSFSAIDPCLAQQARHFIVHLSGRFSSSNSTQNASVFSGEHAGTASVYPRTPQATSPCSQVAS